MIGASLVIWSIAMKYMGLGPPLDLEQQLTAGGFATLGFLILALATARYSLLSKGCGFCFTFSGLVFCHALFQGLLRVTEWQLSVNPFHVASMVTGIFVVIYGAKQR